MRVGGGFTRLARVWRCWLVCENGSENWLGLLYANSRFEVIVTGERSFYAILWI